MDIKTILILGGIVCVVALIVSKILKSGGKGKSTCPACGKLYGGNPGKCPHCGEKLRWK